MAEVLSQSQIDALLNAARSGELDVDKPAEKSEEKKYRKYDFYSPRKFTKDRLKMLNSIFEGYARVINSRINALLHATGVAVNTLPLSPQRLLEAFREGGLLE